MVSYGAWQEPHPGLHPSISAQPDAVTGASWPMIGIW